MRAASAAGASLVQAIQHETTATYFILARADGGQLAYLDVDCYTDYRKDNRTWLLADEVIANRRTVSRLLPAVDSRPVHLLPAEEGVEAVHHPAPAQAVATSAGEKPR